LPAVQRSRRLSPLEKGIAMKLSRHRFLRVGAAALVAAPRLASAQAYPTRPVRIVVAAAPGGANDIVARLMAPWLAERLGQFIVENRPGGSNNIGTEAVVRAPPDGYTLLLVDSTAAINATLYGKLNFVFLRDIAPVAGILRLPYVLVVHPSVPAATVPQLIAYAKANPGRINMASQIRAGKLRALAVTTATRWEGLPDIPTVGDFVSGYEASSVFGLGAPAATPAEIVDRLNRQVNAGLADAKLKARLAELGGAVLAGSPAEFGMLMAEETEKWRGVIRAANIKPE
jgi:tripartite-type tricarboxylate transporter receptor subunit TctC